MLENRPISTQTIKRRVQYLTYRIVTVLRICGIRVANLELKWVLNSSQQVVLVGCKEYQSKHIRQNYGEEEEEKMLPIDSVLQLRK